MLNYIVFCIKKLYNYPLFKLNIKYDYKTFVKLKQSDYNAAGAYYFHEKPGWARLLREREQVSKLLS